MLDPRIRLKHAWLGGILAFLIPGAGHLYQGRYFKALVYSVCILGLFLTGMSLAEWQAVQAPPKKALANGKGGAVLKFVAQSGVGLPVLVALLQRQRLESPRNTRVTTLDGKMTTSFTGTASYLDESGNHTGNVTGTLTLEPTTGAFGKKGITGQFAGKFEGHAITFQLSDHVELGAVVGAEKERPFVAGLVRKNGERTEEIGHLRGGIPRSFQDWFEVPMDAPEEEDLHRRLGKYHELAMVCTWIAGMLNILAIWDAVEGPAYGYGDEPQPEEGKAPQPA